MSSPFCASLLLITIEDTQISELKLWFIFIYGHIANQNSVRFSVSIIFYKFRSSKCKESVCLHYGLDIHFNFFNYLHVIVFKNDIYLLYIVVF